VNQPAALVDQAMKMGATFQVTTDGVTVRRPQGPLPSALLAELRRHKDEIRAELTKRQFKFVFPHPAQRDDEMTELERRVEEEGYVLLWSNVLEDRVAFHRDDVDPATIPAEFVPYSEEELCYLFPEDEHATSENTLCLIHKAKTLGARISGRKDG
jgi:hypothetical protein